MKQIAKYIECLFAHTVNGHYFATTRGRYQPEQSYPRPPPPPPGQGRHKTGTTAEIRKRKQLFWTKVPCGGADSVWVWAQGEADYSDLQSKLEVFYVSPIKSSKTNIGKANGFATKAPTFQCLPSRRMQAVEIALGRSAGSRVSTQELGAALTSLEVG